MLFKELMERELVSQVTNVDAISSILNTQGAIFYIGFDPTADSLHIGHLLQIVTAKRLKDAGLFPIILLGGATAQIGDPTGKSEVRKMLSENELDNNIRSIRSQIIKLLPGFIFVVDNNEWIKNLNYLSFIKEFGPCLSVNNMIKADCFKSRMANGGLSFLEFNYMMLQAYDFFHLFQSQNCQLQIGGDDQWSNILAGINLIHKKTNKDAFGLTLPLLKTASGQKMGKTEKGTIWLDKLKTNTFDFFQFWRNLPDDDIIICFKFLTFIPINDIINIPFSNKMEINLAKKRLAYELTKFVHGKEEADFALKKSESLFENNDISLLEAKNIHNNVNILDIIVNSGFAKSKTEARNLINNRGISINDQIITNPTIQITKSEFGEKIVVKKGKKNFCCFLIQESYVQ